MSALGWAMATLGVLAGLGLVALVIADVWLIQTGRKSISWRLMELGFAHPAVAAAIGTLLGFVVGALVGHFWLPQK
jgi:hypothetical protein